MILAIITLLSGLAISAVAIYYSVIGLSAIFAAAVIPIMIMGTILEISKLVSAWWLKKNWKRAPRFLKSYMLCAVIVLMFITSMGIFGFLSKAHIEQGVPTGDIIAQIQDYDDQIALEESVIEQSRNNLGVLDDQIKQFTEMGYVSKGVKARQDQKEERDFLDQTIRESRAKITELKRQKLPLTGDLRQVEAEVGPIKYIAQLIYGDDPDATILEKAVVWVIITLVFVFDPLAILLLLAAQLSFQWYYEEKKKNEVPAENVKTQTQTETPAKISVEEESDDTLQSEDEGKNETDNENVHEPVMGGKFDNAPKLAPILIPVVRNVEEKTLFEQLDEENVLTTSAEEVIVNTTVTSDLEETSLEQSKPLTVEAIDAEISAGSTHNIEDIIDWEIQNELIVTSEEVVEDEHEEVEEQSVEASIGDDLSQEDEINTKLINVEVPVKQDLDTYIKHNPVLSQEVPINQEQPETAAPQPEVKKKDPVSWIERTPTGQQVKKTTT